MKKHISRLLVYSLVAGVSFLASSCSNDYLDTAPTDSTGAPDAVGTTENAYKTLNGISKLMTTQHSYFGQGFAGENNIMIHYESYPSQNYNYNYYANGWAVIFNQTYHNRTNTIYDAFAWYYYYSIVGSANSIICNIDVAKGSDSDKKFIKASALTFRAYAFEKLLHYYCWRWQDSNNGTAQGIILRLDESTGGMPYSTMAESYAQIYKDLDDAIALFGASGIDRKANEVWTPNVNVAHAVYARAALTRQDYAKALTEAKLARQGYPLMSNAEYHAGFCNPTSEWIFGSFGGSQEQLWYWSYGKSYACNGSDSQKNPTGAGAIGRELINRIPDNDARKALFLTEDKFPGYDWNNEKVLHPNFAYFVDKKLKAEAKAYIGKIAVPGLEAPYQIGYYYLGAQLKFYVFDLPGVGYLPFIRSSEMVLAEAEANYFLGNEADAQAALVELNKKSGRNPQYECTKTGNDLWNEIMDYREVELWGEGFGWSDYKRWNRPVVRKSVKDGGNAYPTVAVTIPVDGANKWTWDVPLNETDYNNALKK